MIWNVPDLDQQEEFCVDVDRGIFMRGNILYKDLKWCRDTKVHLVNRGHTVLWEIFLTLTFSGNDLSLWFLRLGILNVMVHLPET